MMRTWVIFPALLLHAHEAAEAQPACMKTMEHYKRLTDLLLIISLTGLLPLVHEIQCAIKALQTREVYFPDLTRILRRCAQNIRKAYLQDSRFSQAATFRFFLALKAATSDDKSLRSTSPLVFKQGDFESKVLHFVVVDKDKKKTMIPLMTKPLPTGARGRPASIPKLIESRKELKALFTYVQVCVGMCHSLCCSTCGRSAVLFSSNLSFQL
jgi:hypothetical protein